MFLTSDLKIQFLGIIPILSDETGQLTPEQVVALSALLSFKGKSVRELRQEIIEKEQDINKKTQNILKNSSLRGHASIATTPTLAFSFEASKFLDSAITGIIFSSSLMASGRRTGAEPEDIVFPPTIYNNAEAKRIYEKQSIENINCFNWLLEQGVIKDEASKILQYGQRGAGIVVLAAESIIGLEREFEIEKDWMPEEIGRALSLLKKELNVLGIEQLFYTRLAAPRNVYPYPNIFKNPNQPNLARDLKEAGACLKKVNNLSKITNCQITASKGLLLKLKELNQLTQAISQDKERIINEWPRLLEMRRQISRDYNLAVQAQVLSSVAWRVWGEKKRHRTAAQSVESLYYCIDRASKVFSQTLTKRKIKTLSQGEIDKIDLVFSLPPNIRQEQKFLQKYLLTAAKSLSCYQKMLQIGIKPRDAVFVIPRAVRIDVLQSYDLYNLITGYYPLRLCSTVDEQLLRLTTQEALAIKEILKQKGVPELARAISVKCQQTGFCSEKDFCPQIKTAVSGYDQEFHQKIINSLEEKYKKQIILYKTDEKLFK